MNLEDFSEQSTLPTGVVLPPHHDEIMAWVERHLSVRLEGSWVDCEPPEHHVGNYAVPPAGQHTSFHEPSHYGPVQIQDPVGSTSYDPRPPQTTADDQTDATCLYPHPTYGDFDGSSVTSPTAVTHGHYPEFGAGSSHLLHSTAAATSTSPPNLFPTTQGAAYFPTPVLDPHRQSTRFQLPQSVFDQWGTSPTAYSDPNCHNDTIRYHRGANQNEVDVGGPYTVMSSSSSGRAAGLKRKSVETDLEQGGRELKMRRRETTRMDDEGHPSLSGLQGGTFTAGSQPGVQLALRSQHQQIEGVTPRGIDPRECVIPNAVQTLGEGPSVQRGAMTHSVRAEELATAGEVSEEGEEDGKEDDREDGEKEEEVAEGEGEEVDEERRWACPTCKNKDGSPKDFGREFDLTRHFKTVKAHKQGPGFQCPHPPCAKAYTRSDTLRKHIREKHSNELDAEV
ncbi:hypothetical protein EW146_g5722 [Bondarzewia mesenterica]|uniref:C2H2-type domain-containing protein n=1 Tax=Bondarzewia mesenterica TaxID=1095465 RepID=A0A4S4LWC1_9AGAM|nr:hypothetical protein EW146_g5722 [Bondarzewia mesenterica]